MSDSTSSDKAKQYIKYLVRQNPGSLQHSLYEVQGNGVETFMASSYNLSDLNLLKIRLDAFAGVFNKAIDVAAETFQYPPPFDKQATDAINFINGEFACDVMIQLVNFKLDAKMVPEDRIQEVKKLLDLEKNSDDTPKSGS